MLRFTTLALVVLLTACVGIKTQHQQIGASCEAAASSMDVLNAARVAGKITAAQHAKATRAYKTTVPVCEPVATSLDSVKYAALVAAVAELASLQGASK